jgi:vacuolar protein sorting-associated protein 45
MDHHHPSSFTASSHRHQNSATTTTESDGHLVSNIFTNYIKKALKETGSGMKSLLVDDFALAMTSNGMNQTDILKREVFAVEPLLMSKSKSKSLEKVVVVPSREEESLRFVKAVCILRPTNENVNALCERLRGGTSTSSSNSSYGEFHVFFTNSIDERKLRAIAKADARGGGNKVKQIQEIFCDVIAMDECAFVIDSRDCFKDDAMRAFDPNGGMRKRVGNNNSSFQRTNYEYALMCDPSWGVRNGTPLIDRCVEGVTSVCLALKRPPMFRYSAKSNIARRIAEDAQRVASEREPGLFDFGRRNDEGYCHVLIVDRFDDCVTPLLTQWTYQAMVHEIFGISSSNRVRAPDAQKLSKKPEEFILSSREDAFFRDHKYDDYGDVGAAVKKYVDDFANERSKTTASKSTASVDDVAKFVERFPEFRQKSATVAKHVQLVHTLSKVINDRQLMKVSEIEQELACAGTSVNGLEKQVEEIVNDPSFGESEKVRLVALYCLRRETEAPQICQHLIRVLSNHVGGKRIDALDCMLRRGGENARTSDLFGTKTIAARMRTSVSALKGAENVYTRHVPLVRSLVAQCVNGKLPASEYSPTWDGFTPECSKKPAEIIVFIVGGATYAEARAVAKFNASKESNNIKVTIGGYSMLHQSRFIENLANVFDEERGP